MEIGKASDLCEFRASMGSFGHFIAAGEFGGKGRLAQFEITIERSGGPGNAAVIDWR